MAATNIQIYNGGSPTTPGTNFGTATCAASTTSGASTYAIQSGTIDFGATRAASWVCSLTATMSTAPTASQTLDVYIGYSSNATTGYPAGISVGSGVYSGYGASSITNATPQLEWIGSMILAPVTAAQVSNIGIITPKLEYGVVVLVNNSGAVLSSATFGFTSIIDESGV